MPLTNIKIRKKTNAQTTSYTGVSGEVTIDTDKKVIVIHDGTTAGGFSLARESQANSGSSYANSAYLTANSGSSYANSAYLTANSAISNFNPLVFLTSGM